MFTPFESHRNQSPDIPLFALGRTLVFFVCVIIITALICAFVLIPLFCSSLLTDHLVHGAVSVRRAAGAVGAGSDPGGSGHRPPLLCNAALGKTAGGQSLDRRRDADLLRLQHRHRRAARPRLLQQVLPQLLQVSILLCAPLY